MRIEKQSHTVFTPLADETAVLLNLETLLYYSLNRTGAMMWRQIESEKDVTLDDLVRNTCKRFDVEEEAARRDLRAFVERLERFKMIRAIA